MTTVRLRKSNMELLRIISMVLVLFVHFDGASLELPIMNGSISQATSRDLWQLFFESFTIIGVNCFTLISGFFGIRLRWKGLGKYLFQCLFYSVGIYSALLFISPGRFSLDGWIESWLVLTHTDLWYVPAYFALMLLAPFINAGFDMLAKKTSAAITVVFIVFNVWAGWWNGGSFNANGYTIVQLMMMYMIGRTISINKGCIDRIGRKGAMVWSIVCYLFFSIITALCAVYDVQKAYAYNAPFVILQSVAFFIIFYSIDFQSKVVNYIAKSAFAVYLLHKAPLVWGGVLKPLVKRLWDGMSLIEFTLTLIGLAIFIYLLAMIIDMVRRWLSALIFR